MVSVTALASYLGERTVLALKRSMSNANWYIRFNAAKNLEKFQLTYQELEDAIKVFLNGVSVFFILYLIGYSTFLFLVVVIGSSTLYQTRQEVRLKNVLESNYYILVTIIVPAYNEEVTVVDPVRSLLALDYNVYEIFADRNKKQSRLCGIF